MSEHTMLYCDNMLCRVNEFEAGSSGKCPACGSFGEEIPGVDQ